MPERIILCRHALRHDTINKQWLFTSPTPYDPPLAMPRGFEDARKCGEQIMSQQPELPKQIFLHCSPFLRCAQTAGELARVIAKQKSCNITIRLDAVFGEWLTEDYFAEISPPPVDGHRSISESSLNWLKNTNTLGFSGRSMSVSTYQNAVRTSQDSSSYVIDSDWPLDKFGTCGEYGEEWTDMHERVCRGLHRLLEFYEGVPDNFIVILVTHGAICNSLLGYLSNKPLLQKVGLSSFAIAERDQYKKKEWHIKIQSMERNQLVPENDAVMQSETLNKDLLGVPDSSGRSRKFSAPGLSSAETPPDDQSSTSSPSNTLFASSVSYQQPQSNSAFFSPALSLASSVDESEETAPSFMLSFGT